MRERLVGLRHLVHVVALLDDVALPLERVENLGGHGGRHAHAAAARRELRRPAERERKLPVGGDRHRHGIGRAADAAGLHLDLGLHVLDRGGDDLERVLERLLVLDKLGGILLHLLGDLVDRAVDPEFEFYLFDDVTWSVEGRYIGATVDAKQSYWNSDVEGHGVIVPKQKNYHIAKPFDTSYECRSEMCMLMKEMGIDINYHHPEVAASGQFEIEPQLGEVVHMADATMMIKYIIHNTALKYGKSATFMPKPIYGEAGSGMHVHMILFKDGQPVFSDDNGYSHLSETAHYFIGGLLKHIGSLCAITNPSTNSFKRLVPGFEAPVTVGYATSNRSAVIRIPAYAKSPDKRRFELRNPDATCNPYFCYAAILMAGLDGIKNKIDPHANGWGPYDMNLYNLPEEEKAKLQGLPVCLEDALDCLEKDYAYLTEGGVFPEELIRNFIKTKRAECRQLAAIPNPAEFDKYYNL